MWAILRKLGCFHSAASKYHLTVRLPEANRILKESFSHTNAILKYCVQHGIPNIERLAHEPEQRLWLEELTKFAHVDRSDLTSAKDQLFGLSLEILPDDRIVQLLQQHQQGFSCRIQNGQWLVSLPRKGGGGGGGGVITMTLPDWRVYVRAHDHQWWIHPPCYHTNDARPRKRIDARTTTTTTLSHDRGPGHSQPSRLRLPAHNGDRKRQELFSLRLWAATSPAPLPVFGSCAAVSGSTSTDAIQQDNHIAHARRPVVTETTTATTISRGDMPNVLALDQAIPAVSSNPIQSAVHNVQVSVVAPFAVNRVSAMRPPRIITTRASTIEPNQTVPSFVLLPTESSPPDGEALASAGNGPPRRPTRRPYGC